MTDPAPGARARVGWRSARGLLSSPPCARLEHTPPTRARRADPVTHPPAVFPVFVHLALVLMLGLYIPPYLAQWYRQAAAMIG